MEIHHKTLPIQNWREFAKEVGIIVLGVLIALSAEQAVEALHWYNAVADGRDALHREIAFDAAYLRDRISVAPCIDKRLTLADSLIEAAAAGTRQPLRSFNTVGPGRLTLISEWRAEQASQTLTHFPRDEFSRLGAFYDQLESIQGWIEREEDVWAEFGTLNSAGPLAPADVAILRRDLQLARNYETLMLINAKRQVDRARQLGVEPGPQRQDWPKLVCRL